MAFKNNWWTDPAFRDTGCGPAMPSHQGQNQAVAAARRLRLAVVGTGASVDTGADPFSSTFCVLLEHPTLRLSVSVVPGKNGLVETALSDKDVGRVVDTADTMGYADTLSFLAASGPSWSSRMASAIRSEIDRVNGILAGREAKNIVDKLVGEAETHVKHIIVDLCRVGSPEGMRSIELLLREALRSIDALDQRLTALRNSQGLY